MDIKLEEIGNKGSFYIEENKKRLAEMTFSKSGTTRIIIDHTEVSDVLKGKGVGKQRISAGVNYARKNNIKIIPLCPFAKSVFAKAKEFQDVIDT